MIRISNLKLKIEEPEDQLRKKMDNICKNYTIKEFHILKKSLDARNKAQLYWVYQVCVSLNQEEKFLKHFRHLQAEPYEPVRYHLPQNGHTQVKYRPVIIGTGPAGMFCGLALARKGLCPVFYERGACVEERMEDVEHYWTTGELKENSNVQFGEGGAGTFSDGKLNTLVKDTFGRNQQVLKEYVHFGAPESILYENKPHIGTDLLVAILKNMRQEMIMLGCTFHFHSQVIDFQIENGSLKEILVQHDDQKEIIPVENVILAIGHSARDTFQVLYENGMKLEPKSFAVGFRVEHPQEMINQSQYGIHYPLSLPSASYKLTAKSATTERGVYSFCMCPGGYVVNASSEERRLAVNGMSYHHRDSGNSNSAVIVSVTPDDFSEPGPLGGISFQRELEKRAFEAGNGKIPQQLYTDFIEGKPSQSYGSFSSKVRGQTELTNCRHILPEVLNQAFIEGMTSFGHKIKGFDRPDAILSGIESRTSSPVRMIRNDELVSNWKGLYPCGEGAGYAGGIMSAAMDGLKIAEKIISIYQPINE